MMAWASMMGAYSHNVSRKLGCVLNVLAVSWGVFTMWSQITDHDGWKLLTDEDKIS